VRNGFTPNQKILAIFNQSKIVIMIKQKTNPGGVQISTLIIFSALLLLLRCNTPTNRETSAFNGPNHPKWSENATLYEVNTRQYTPAGTFTAFLPHLDSLQKLGTDIIWFMPIYPVGEQNRKGSLGSYYSVKDYTSVNPEFGTLDDFKNVVNEAHDRGMHVLIDWVPNHTSWDHTWTTRHPEWYDHDSTGNFVSPYDWTDVIQLDYSNHKLWKGMVDAMKFWITNAGVDGFRCDYPGQVPVAFWDSARTVFEKIKPVFMLAEDEGHTEFLDSAFDMNYAWELMHLMEGVARGEKNATDLEAYFQQQKETLPVWAYKLNCMTNHDENSWNGTIFERYGDAVKPLAILMFTAPGMPLIYSGQEIGLNKRLRFFEKDTIFWKASPWTTFYSQLIALKKEQQALWNGQYGGEWSSLSHTQPEQILAFSREKGNSGIVVILNLSPATCSTEIGTLGDNRSYTEFYTGKKTTFTSTQTIDLQPWTYRLYICSDTSK
jgi:glycosidase